MAEVAKNIQKITDFFNVFYFLVVVLLGWFVDRFLIDFWWIWGSKIDQQSIKNRSKRRSKTRCKSGWILDGSWIDFWRILGPSWGVSWGQVSIKIWEIEVPRLGQKKGWKSSMQAMQVHAGITQAGGGWSLKSINKPAQGTPFGTLDTPHRATRARWRIKRYIQII